ncbi:MULTISPECIES: TlpA disulfide reductase family protein [unclassified Dysgonomonas]|uniref:TlpA family protein disulfide reductase n=1 Tax=unclassified Dysgonomonas TaxID=2630389 RepID=UPI0024733E91|nr:MULTISPECIES: TlpA disulfide reductase family protein [unclassified Dysgonomonas]
MMSCSFISAQIKSEKYIVLFEKKAYTKSDKYNSGSFLYADRVTDISSFKGIPQADAIAVYVLLANPTLPDGLKNADENKIHLCISLDKKEGTKSIIADCNGNKKFSDEKVYTFSLKDYNIPPFSEEQEQLCIRFSVNSFRYEPATGFTPTEVYLYINPFYHDLGDKENYLTEDDYYLDFLIASNNYMKGSVSINDRLVDIYEGKSGRDITVSHLDKKMSKFRFVSQEHLLGEPLLEKKIGDTLSVNNRMVFLESIVGNNLYLEDLGALTDSSRVGSCLPVLYSNSLSTGKPLCLNDLMKDKYVFIDFWGSWCGPCIESLPEIKELYDKIKGREDVLIIGIALENEKDIEKLQGIIEQENVRWPNVWNSYSTVKNLESVHGKLKMETFPTYMLIDKQGKIVYREGSSFKTKEAINVFLKLIKL